MYLSSKFSTTVTALASISLFSSFKVGTCENIIGSLKSFDGVSVAVEGKVIPTQKHVVDPWFRPPRGVETQQAVGLTGDFEEYPRITMTPFDTVTFKMRPIDRKGSTNTQRHGVYAHTDRQLVRDYLDGISEHHCSKPIYTEENLCQVIEYQGLNATDCPDHKTLFPLLEIFGSAEEIEYTTASGSLAALADSYGVEAQTGSKVLAFDCPWIQRRNDDGTGRTSHCIGGMYLIVEVLSEVEVMKSAESVTCTKQKSKKTRNK